MDQSTSLWYLLNKIIKFYLKRLSRIILYVVVFQGEEIMENTIPFFHRIQIRGHRP